MAMSASAHTSLWNKVQIRSWILKGQHCMLERWRIKMDEVTESVEIESFAIANVSQIYVDFTRVTDYRNGKKLLVQLCDFWTEQDYHYCSTFTLKMHHPHFHNNRDLRYIYIFYTHSAVLLSLQSHTHEHIEGDMGVLCYAQGHTEGAAAQLEDDYP